MAGTSENSMIGLDKCCVAPLLTDDGTNVPTYGTPIALAGAVSAGVTKNGEVAVDWADNGPFFTTNSRGNTDMTLEVTNIAPATYANILGMNRANGITQETAMDQAPYFAMGFRVWIGGTDANGNNIYKYVWLLKGRFSVPDETNETKKESISYQHMSLKATFVKTAYEVNGKGLMSTHARSDIDTAASVCNAWFNAPVINTNIDTTAVTVTAAATAANPLVFTFAKGGTSFSMAESTLVTGSTVLILLGGTEVAGTGIWSAQATTAPVYTFTPTTAFASSNTLDIAVNGVRDTNGVAVTPYIVQITVA